MTGCAMVCWFDQCRCKGFLCPLQDFDKSITLGWLGYFGRFLNCTRLVSELKTELKKDQSSLPEAKKTKWKIACCTKTWREIEQDEEEKGKWKPLMLSTPWATSRPMHATGTYIDTWRVASTENNPGSLCLLCKSTQLVVFLQQQVLGGVTGQPLFVSQEEQRKSLQGNINAKK